MPSLAHPLAVEVEPPLLLLAMLAPSPFGSRGADRFALGSRDSAAGDGGEEVAASRSDAADACCPSVDAVSSVVGSGEVDGGTGDGMVAAGAESGVREGDELSDLGPTPIGLVSDPARERVPTGLIDGDELEWYIDDPAPAPAPYTPRIACCEGCPVC